jgi:hypothetical protein
MIGLRQHVTEASGKTSGLKPMSRRCFATEICPALTASCKGVVGDWYDGLGSSGIFSYQCIQAWISGLKSSKTSIISLLPTAVAVPMIAAPAGNPYSSQIAYNIPHSKKQLCVFAVLRFREALTALPVL